jgi:selT/selW/selH-like putative selenoprotein
VRARLVPGDKGIFDVAADGKLVFSKYRAGRFPEPGEVAAALRGARARG